MNEKYIKRTVHVDGSLNFSLAMTVPEGTEIIDEDSAEDFQDLIIRRLMAGEGDLEFNFVKDPAYEHPEEYIRRMEEEGKNDA